MKREMNKTLQSPHRLGMRIFAAVLLGSSPSAFAEFSIAQPIAKLLYDGNADYFYITGSAKWGAPSCPNATYGQVRSSVPGRKQLLAIALAAKTSGANVLLQGSCSPVPGESENYFDVHYIGVQSQ